MEEQHIKEANQKYVRFFNSSNLDGLASLHTDDAVVMPPNNEFVEGKDKIISLLKDELNAGACDLHFTDRDIIISRNLAYHEGTYSLNINDKNGKQIGNDRGKYLVVWEKQNNNNWLMKKDIWNTSLPANSFNLK